MADSKELKPKSFRIDDETAERFKAISGKIGGNQQETLSKLIEAYEFQAGKTVLTERKSDIELFERHVTTLTRMYMSSLEDSQNLSETIRTEYDALLKSKDDVIKDLQDQLTTSKRLKEEASKQSKYYADENVRLNNHIASLTSEFEEKMDDMQSMLSDKDSLNKALIGSCNDLKQKIDDMKADREKLSELQEELLSLKASYSSLMSEKVEIKRELERERETAERAAGDYEVALKRQQEQAQLQLDKSLLGLDRKYQIQIQELTESKQAEIYKYQEKYFDLLEQMKKNQ